jgi:hypothetical protein
MSVGDIYVVKQHSTMFVESMLNVYFFRQQSQVGGEGAEGLFEGVDAAIMANWIDCVHTQITTTNLEIFAILNPTDFFDATPDNSVGTRTVANIDREPSWVAFSFKSNRAGAGSRSSFKRYAGLQNADISGQLLDTTFVELAAVEALQAALGNAVASVAGSTFVPIQVASGWKVDVSVTENFLLTDWQSATLTSQVSRKPT